MCSFAGLAGAAGAAGAGVNLLFVLNSPVGMSGLPVPLPRGFRVLESFVFHLYAFMSRFQGVSFTLINLFL